MRGSQIFIYYFVVFRNLSICSCSNIHRKQNKYQPISFIITKWNSKLIIINWYQWANCNVMFTFAFAQCRTQWIIFKLVLKSLGFYVWIFSLKSRCLPVTVVISTIILFNLTSLWYYCYLSKTSGNNRPIKYIIKSRVAKLCISHFEQNIGHCRWLFVKKGNCYLTTLFSISLL